MSEETKGLDISAIVPAAAGIPDANALMDEMIGPPVEPPSTSLAVPELDAAPVRTRGKKKVTTLHLNSNTCRWPIGDPVQPDFHYCGEPPLHGRNYCGKHDAMSMQPTSRRKAPAAPSS